MLIGITHVWSHARCPLLKDVLAGLGMMYAHRTIHLDRQGRVVLSLERSSSARIRSTPMVPADAVQMRTCQSFVSDFNRDADDSNGSTTTDLLNTFYVWISALWNILEFLIIINFRERLLKRSEKSIFCWINSLRNKQALVLNIYN